MKDLIDIYTDRLNDGKQESFKGKVSFESLFEGGENAIEGAAGIEVEGKAYIASDFLIIHASIKAPLKLACSICSAMTPQIIHIKDHYLTKPLEEIPHKVFSLKPLFREAILLQLPSVVECEGNCPERQWAKQYMSPCKDEAQNSYHPFADL